MRPIPGTVTDPAMDLVMPHATCMELFEEGFLMPDPEKTVILSDEYQILASTTAIYPRVYTEDQVRQIAGILSGALEDLHQTPMGDIFEATNRAMDMVETPFNRLVYPVLGLVGEAAEIANKIKKIARDDQGRMDLDKSEEVTKELGDVSWYVASIATELKTPLSRIFTDNLKKLFSRKERGVLGGSGDNR